MIVDSSALLTILFAEPDRERLAETLDAASILRFLYQRPRFPTGLACEAFPPPRGDG
jgi:hypothetical protein